MRNLRVFYRKSDNELVWYHETHSPEGVKAVCPSTIEQDLADLPNKMPDGENPLGGSSSDYGSIEVKEADIDAYLASDANKVVAGKLLIGEPRPEPEPISELPPRDLLAELEARVKALENK